MTPPSGRPSYWRLGFGTPGQQVEFRGDSNDGRGRYPCRANSNAMDPKARRAAGDLKPQREHEARDEPQLPEIDLFRRVGGLVIVGMETGEEENDRHAAAAEVVLIAAGVHAL